MTTPARWTEVAATVLRAADLERRRHRVTLLYYRLALEPRNKGERRRLAERLDFAHWLVETGRLGEGRES